MTDTFRDVPASADGPFPLVLFSHGFGSFRFDASALVHGIASWGFVVAAPAHIERDRDALVTNPEFQQEVDEDDEAAVEEARPGSRPSPSRTWRCWWRPSTWSAPPVACSRAWPTPTRSAPSGTPPGAGRCSARCPTGGRRGHRLGRGGPGRHPGARQAVHEHRRPRGRAGPPGGGAGHLPGAGAPQAPGGDRRRRPQLLHRHLPGRQGGQRPDRPGQARSGWPSPTGCWRAAATGAARRPWRPAWAGRSPRTSRWPNCATPWAWTPAGWAWAEGVAEDFPPAQIEYRQDLG